MTAGQSDFPIDTLERLLRDHERRILQQERRPQGAVNPDTEPDLARMETAPADDPDLTVYARDTGLVHHQGTTRTLAEWQAGSGP